MFKNSKSDKAVLAVMLAVMVIVICSFSLPGYKESLLKQRAMAEQEMEHLKEKNDGIRSELSVLEPRVSELNKLQNENKSKWYELEEKRFDIVKSLDQINGSLSIPEPVQKTDKQYFSVTKKGCGDDVNETLSYAYEISGRDKRFVKMLITENGLVNIDRKGPVGEYGYCQISPIYHPEITNDDRFLTDWKWQIDQCYKLYSNNTIFYGIIRYDNNPKFRKQVDSLLTFN